MMAPADDGTETERKLRCIIALAADAVISTDGSFRITMFNRAAESVFGYRTEDILGKPLDLLLPEAARGAHHEHLARFRQSAVQAKEMGHRGQIWGRRSTGELFPAEASVSKIDVGAETHFTAVLRDVSEQRRAEQEREALLVQATDARAVAESAERRVGFLARASELLHSSLAYEETFGALLRLIVPELATYCVVDVVDELDQMRRLHVVHGDPRKQALCDRLQAYPRSQARYLTRRAILGNKAELVPRVTDSVLTEVAEDAEHLAILRALAPASMMFVPLRVRDRTLGALLFAREAGHADYTETDLAFAMELAQRAASAVDNAQLYDGAQTAIRARDDVLAVVSHDLRNPLAVISMFASSLLESNFGDEEHNVEAMRAIQDATRWAERLIQDLLDLSAIEAGGLSLALRADDPVMVVTKAVLMFEDLAAVRSVTLVTELPEQLPRIYCDSDRVLQALGNLIGNALRFTPEGGQICIGARTEADCVDIFVADNGPGIPDEDVPHIFDRFWTARRDSRVRGTGMGLAIVRGIIEAHGGRVRVRRNASRGATFVMCLPLEPVTGPAGELPGA